MHTIKLIDLGHQILANPSKDGDAKPWIYRRASGHDSQVA
jgi:hypothetical protein